MRGRHGAIAWMATALILAGCVGDDSPEDVTEEERDLAPITELETFVVVEGIPDPVPVPGQPAIDTRSGPGTDLFGVAGRHDIYIAVPESWTDPQSLGTLCRWTERLGLHSCTSLSAYGRGPITLQLGGTAEPGETVEIWLGDEHPRLTRRLWVGPSTDPGVVLELVLADGYTSLADVLTRQPPDGGHYLVPAP